MVSEQDLSLLAARGVLEKLNGYMDRKDQAAFYPVAFESGVYQGQTYALPYESNPILMCVNKDLLDKEGIAVPKEGWTLEEFYTICKKLTKDTNGDGQLDQFGSTEYTWKEALAANGGQLFQGGMLKLTAPEVKESLTFLQKLEELNKNYKVSFKDFDQGKVAFYPMTLAQYRTYKPYPYHVSKYSNFTWTCIPMPAKSKTTKATLVTTTSFAMSARTPHSKLAWELMQVLTEDPEIQQTLFAESQGISVMPDVVKSRSSKDLLQVDDFGADSLTNQTLNRIMEQAVESSPKNVSKEVLEKLDKVGNLEELNELRVKILGKKGEFTAIMKEMGNIAAEKIIEVTKVSDVTTLEEATVPAEPSSPNIRRNVILGFLGGSVLMSIFIIAVEILDDRVKKPEDIEEVMGLTLLGVIPDMNRM